MAAKGNQYWRRVKNWKCGAERAYTPAELWDIAIQYFDHVEKNPLIEQKAFGSGLVADVAKMRAMTITDFCLFANISRMTFDNYSKEDAYLYITSRIKDIIYTQKFQGAAADLLNPSIIARELGLAEKSENKHDIAFTDLLPNGMTDEELMKYRSGE